MGTLTTMTTHSMIICINLDMNSETKDVKSISQENCAISYNT